MVHTEDVAEQIIADPPPFIGPLNIDDLERGLLGSMLIRSTDWEPPDDAFQSREMVAMATVLCGDDHYRNAVNFPRSNGWERYRKAGEWNADRVMDVLREGEWFENQGPPYWTVASWYRDVLNACLRIALAHLDWTQNHWMSAIRKVRHAL